MQFYTSSAASLIMALSIPDLNISEVIFVSPRQREFNSIGELKRAELRDDTFRFIDYICQHRNIEIKKIKYLEFVNTIKHPVFLDSSLDQKKFSHKRSLILSNSDIYCMFGFSNYTNFIVTKKQLQLAWQRSFKFQTSNSYFVLGQPKNFKKFHNVIEIDLIKAQAVLTSIYMIFEENIFRYFGIEKTANYALIMPPQIRVTDKSFMISFFQYTKFLSNNLGLKLLIKPHPNEDLAKLKSFIPETHSIIQHSYYNIPVELLFPAQNIVKVIASPSSTLPFVSGKRLEVLMPKNRKIFRQSFLDQIPFLDSNRLTYRLI